MKSLLSILFLITSNIYSITLDDLIGAWNFSPQQFYVNSDCTGDYDFLLDCELTGSMYDDGFCYDEWEYICCGENYFLCQNNCININDNTGLFLSEYPVTEDDIYKNAIRYEFTEEQCYGSQDCTSFYNSNYYVECYQNQCVNYTYNYWYFEEDYLIISADYGNGGLEYIITAQLLNEPESNTFYLMDSANEPYSCSTVNLIPNNEIIGCTDINAYNFNEEALFTHYFSCIYADLNNDNVLNISDIIVLVNTILSIQNQLFFYIYEADLNHDFTNNVIDIVALVNLILG